MEPLGVTKPSWGISVTMWSLVKTTRPVNLFQKLEVPMLGLAGLAISLYLLGLLGLWTQLGLEKVYETVSLIIDVVFVLDLLTKIAVLRKDYLKSPWFLIDFISSLPIFGLLSIGPNNTLQSLRFVRGFRLFRILRTLRTLRTLLSLKVFKDFNKRSRNSEDQSFNRALVSAVLVYTCTFLVLVSDIYADVTSATMLKQAMKFEFYLVLGSLLGMLLVMIVVRFQVNEMVSQQIRSLLNVALPEQVAEHFMKHPESYDKTVRMPATIIFCDIVGFTSTVEVLDGDLVSLKHHLEKAMDAVTQIHKGYDLIIDKFIGDAVMSFRGGDLVDGDPADHAWRVVRAALDGMEALAKLDNPYFTRMKIGGASSEASLIGAFGTSSRLSYTILGDRVNLAARLEAAVGQCGTGNLFCARTQDLTKNRDDIIWRRVGKLQVQGKIEALDIYEAFLASSLPDTSWMDLYADALEKYERGAFVEAKQGFEATTHAREGGDLPAQRFMSQCSQLIEHGLPDGWKPVFKTSK